ncbi:hypothetical protein KI688_003934 [Linnemannia hyalina]|uniref:DUF3020 domain-containing protein n=2 Tax=Mortierellaceae TaxID=4854 RepID=A0A9P6FI40_9FUNG|nr:hypothetical protein EC957_010098 [Mortierella hygrophila]KAG9063822.1 hypothetical protein KI688_003934 [Linnemannia hyalina]
MIRDETAFQAQAALDQLAATAHATALSAAAAPATPTTPSTPTTTTSTAPGTAATATATATAGAPLDPAEVLKKDLMSQRVRNDNRERKKRWREANEDRNKDNDLRCRVNKRANKLFGKQESEHKSRWIEEEFGKRQMKRKDKERRRNPNSAGSMEPTPAPTTPTVSLNEHLALHQQAQAAAQAAAVQAQAQAQAQAHQLQASQLAHPQFDPSTVKTALALNDLVKKNGSHLDLAQLTGVLTDPNLARQLIEIEANNPATQASATMMVMNTQIKSEHESKAGHMMDADYPMDAVLTLMQLNGSWKA